MDNCDPKTIARKYGYDNKKPASLDYCMPCVMGFLEKYNKFAEAERPTDKQVRDLARYIGKITDEMDKQGAMKPVVHEGAQMARLAAQDIKNAKSRLDKVLAIDKYAHLMHYHGYVLTDYVCMCSSGIKSKPSRITKETLDCLYKK